MLVDSTYFYGPISIAQKTEANVAANLQQFINRYEPRFMEKLLGYELYRDFKAGLLIDPLASEWVDLLYGKEYTDRKNNVRYWKGFVAYTNGITVNGYVPDDIIFIVDRGNLNDPVSGQPQYRNSFLIGKTFRVIERVTGPLADTIDINIVANGFDLIARNFNAGAIYSIQFINAVPLPDPGILIPGMDKKSPIANYIYYYYLRDNTTQTTGTGEKIVDSENTTNVANLSKCTDAWNDMVTETRECREFLLSNADVYTNFIDPFNRIYRFNNSVYPRREVFQTINSFNW